MVVATEHVYMQFAAPGPTRRNVVFPVYPTQVVPVRRAASGSHPDAWTRPTSAAMNEQRTARGVLSTQATSTREIHQKQNERRGGRRSARLTTGTTRGGRGAVRGQRPALRLLPLPATVGEGRPLQWLWRGRWARPGRRSWNAAASPSAPSAPAASTSTRPRHTRYRARHRPSVELSAGPTGARRKRSGGDQQRR